MADAQDGRHRDDRGHCHHDFLHAAHHRHGPGVRRDLQLAALRQAFAVAAVTEPAYAGALHDMAKKWYVINTYSGYEDKVKDNLLRRVESMNLTDRVFHVEVPEETVVEIKDGKRVEKPRKVFPGYVLVEMELDEESWHVVRSTPGVTSF